MARTKRKTVFNAEPEQISEIELLVHSGRYRSTSELLREAIEEKLERLRAEQLAEQVARFVEAGHADEDVDLIDVQAVGETA